MNDHARPPIDWPWIVAGGLLIALGDMSFATSVWFTWTLDGLAKVFRSIAAGVLGQASAQGGTPAALLGVALHVAMATTFVLVYTLVARHVPRLLERLFVFGIAYGVLLYVVMNFVVMPLSRIGRSPTLAHPDWIVLSVLVHMVFGVICVACARRELGQQRQARTVRVAG